jgi:hypothetical protein
MTWFGRIHELFAVLGWPGNRRAVVGFVRWCGRRGVARGAGLWREPLTGLGTAVSRNGCGCFRSTTEADRDGLASLSVSIGAADAARRAGDQGRATNHEPCGRRASPRDGSAGRATVGCDERRTTPVKVSGRIRADRPSIVAGEGGRNG